MASNRRLAAIMFADMVGYTSATQRDEAGTLHLIQEQEELVGPLLTAHKGREVKSTGDGFLAEFDSALRAVQCAIDIQQHLHERNARPGITPIPLRIGVHLGDVEERGADIFGDAVNIAARVEPLAHTGGVCITGQVFDQVQNKLPHRFEKLGPQTLKNVVTPVDIYRVVLPWAPGEPAPGKSGQNRLAVLPFSSISPESKDEYFAEGLTEELITVISQIGGLQVIARTSVMPYKSSSKSVAQIGNELGVSSVLEGSVRKSGNRLRITAQLINAGSEAHIWAKSYDRELDDVFVVQSDIARQVAEALKVELRAPEEKRLESRPSVRTDSYLAYLKGRTLLHDSNIESLGLAKEQFEKALALDSRNAAACSGLADVLRLQGWTSRGGPRADWDARGRELVQRAIELDPNLAQAHASMGLIRWEEFDYEAAVKEFELALSLNPSDSLAHNWYGVVLQDMHRGEESLNQFRLAEAADPLWLGNLGNLVTLLSWLGRRDEALPVLEKLQGLAPGSVDYFGALSWYLLCGPDPASGLEATKRWIETEPEGRWKDILRPWLWSMSGETEKVREFLRVEETRPEVPQIAWAVAVLYGQIGDLDNCFRWLDKAVNYHFVAMQMFRYFPLLAPVRSDPRFQSILHRMNLD